MRRRSDFVMLAHKSDNNEPLKKCFVQTLDLILQGYMTGLFEKMVATSMSNISIFRTNFST